MARSVDPDRQQLSRVLKEIPQDTPIVMLNLLRFRDQAVYPDGHGAEPCTGAEAYHRYSQTAIRKITEVGGQPIWAGNVQGSVIAPPGEEWDEVLLVEYPSIGAFMDMIRQPDYQEAAVHRTAALEDARLICTVQTRGQEDRRSGAQGRS
jgi:uncharacterized protein (DUF1330 family)